MGVPTSEVSYTPAMPKREDHEVHKRTCGGIGGKKRGIDVPGVVEYSFVLKITSVAGSYRLIRILRW